MRLFVIGASGHVGSLVVAEALRRGHRVTGQSRDPARVPAGADVAAGSAGDAGFLTNALPGHDAVIFALGVDHRRPTTLFSGSTAALIPAMHKAGVRRLVAITGIGAGETKGHGGWLYNRVIYPLFTRNRYEDKTRQEAIIAASDLDWTVIRPGPFVKRPAPGPLQALWPIPPGVQVTAITCTETAAFVIDTVEKGTWRHAMPLFGHVG